MFENKLGRIRRGSAKPRVVASTNDLFSRQRGTRPTVPRHVVDAPLAPPSANTGLSRCLGRRYLLRLLVRREVSARYQGSSRAVLVLRPARHQAGDVLLRHRRDHGQGGIEILPSTCSPACRALLHRDVQCRDALHRAQQVPGPEDGGATGDVPRGLHAGLGVPRHPRHHPADRVLRRARVASRSVGMAAAAPSSSSRCSARRSPWCSAPPTSSSAILSNVVQTLTQFTTFSVPMIYPYSAVSDRFGEYAQYYLLNPIAEAVLLFQRGFWVGTTDDPAKTIATNMPAQPVRDRVRPPRRGPGAAGPGAAGVHASREQDPERLR